MFLKNNELTKQYLYESVFIAIAIALAIFVIESLKNVRRISKIKNNELD